MLLLSDGKELQPQLSVVVLFIRTIYTDLLTIWQLLLLSATSARFAAQVCGLLHVSTVPVIR
jgi:hypothetical protein